MPLLQVNAAGTTVSPAAAATTLAGALDAALAGLPDHAPAVVLLHGYRFSPSDPDHSPHSHILSLTPERDCWKAVSWPRALGFSGAPSGEGLCLAFGWEARGTIWQAYGEAARAGRALAALVDEIRARRPGRPVHILAHSLGARVALSAMPHLAEGALGRIVLMTPAEFASRAEAALDTPAARAAQVLNVTSRENDLYDFLLESLVAPQRPRDHTLGHGLAGSRPGWVDIQIDHAETLAALRRLGFDIAQPARRVCHWSPYIRPGMFDLYAALIRGALPFEMLRAALPEAKSRRWSRLLAPPRPVRPLPFFGNAAS
ncbi:pimeloyl-ACP methyl ester carboxylesterase [Rhodovulum iodosum]|uniref:Pimeloyl-ACP methyl ester carboxylesterase n=1 Tax=Rhodovulum iodosum TaxID=68291 RepID=A0ABV3XNT0_9RHOB|nr:alpha/beta hydrolase [Rhodovulum robiginosum]RSK34863.1 alpha/beta hydrolase [Rhodovulum robiginosum]